MNGSPPRGKRERCVAGLLILTSVAAALVLGELILRYGLPRSTRVFPANLEQHFKPQPGTMPGISGEKRFATNAQGIRGDELTPADAYRVLAIGGSTTECLFLDQSEAWPSLVQQYLNENPRQIKVWVGNAGRSGRTSRHHLLAMRYLPLDELRIDAVIILLGINDLSKRLSQDTSYDPEYLAKPEAIEMLLAETFYGRTAPYPNDPFFKRTATWQLLRAAKEKLLKHDAQDNVQDEVGAVFDTWRKHRRQAVEIRPELPDLSSAVAEYAGNLNRIIDTARARSVRLILMTQPTMWSPQVQERLGSLMWLGGIGEFQRLSGKPYYAWDALDRGMAKYNATLLNICRERDVECIDLASRLAKDTSVFYDDAHFNESGARQVARVVADYLLGRAPFADARSAQSVADLPSALDS
jgi:lysophospholipase L1-like esterase